ncbi:MAG: type II toxin-antitoxin system VapC family toxin [Bacteroidetes bacterium]|nr:MAG: type II toxin-antitoxin system VapC family toxin [Bacteroidota bacterium]
MGQKYLIDSNAIIDYLSGSLNKTGMQFLNRVINEIPNISVINKIEILSFNTSREDSNLLNGFISDSNIFGLSDEIVQKTIDIRKKHKLKTPDAIVAATSIIYNFSLITRNIKDFKKIKDLKTHNPHID